jgi:hypothetical protein
MERASAENRPWISIVEPTQLRELVPEREVKCLVKIINTGKSPALNVRCKTGQTIQIEPIKDAVVNLEDAETNVTGMPWNIAPSGTSENMYSLFPGMPAGLVDNLKSGKQAMIFAVDFRYSDVTGAEHRTVVHYLYNRTTGGMDRIGCNMN